MKVSMLISLMLKKLGHGGTDIEYPDTALDYSPEALVYLNEAYFRAVQRLRPVHEEAIELNALGCLETRGLSMPATCIRYLIRDGKKRRVYMPKAWDMDELPLGGARPNEIVVVGYEFDPPPLKGEQDEPLLRPEFIHAALSDYAAARIMELQGRREEANLLYASFERALSLLRPHRGPFTNKLSAWNGL